MSRSNRILAAFVLLICADGARADTPALFPAAAFPAGEGAYRVAVADFDGDGIPDIVSSNALGDTLTLLRGAGDASFYGPEVIATAERPLGLAAGDLDDDGLMDLVAAHADTDGVVTYLGLGTGAFAFRQRVTVGETPDPVALGDLDLDGVLDVVVGCHDDGSTSSLLGDGTGQLTAAHTAVTGRWPVDIVVADVVGDAWPDACVANTLDENVIVLAGVGGGAFAAPVARDVGDEALDLAIAELTGDARVDLAVAASKTFVLPATGGDLGPAVQLPGFGFDLPAGDFDGDGDADLLPSNDGGGPVLVQTAPGQFAAGLGKHAGPVLAGSIVADLDADGALDIVATIGSATTPDVIVVRGIGNGSFVVPPTMATPSLSYSDVLLADFDLDGHLDLALGVEPAATSDRVEVRAGAGDGSFAAPVVALGLETPRIVVVLDANGDGLPDLAAVSMAFPQLGVALGNGNLTFTPMNPVSLPLFVYDACAADFNLDGDVDLALGTHVTSSGPSFAQVRFGSGNGKFPAIGTVSIQAPPIVDIEEGDLDADGFTDLAVACSLSGVFIVPATGAGSFGAAQAVDLDGRIYSIDLADLDADGFLDLLAADLDFFVTPEPIVGVSVLKGDGDGTFTLAQQLLKHRRVRHVTAEDVDGDGLLDMLAALDVPHRLHAIALGRGDGSFDTPQLFGLMHDPNTSVPGDVNEDGRMDIVVPSNTSGVTSVRLNVADGLWTSVGQGLAGSAGVPKLAGSGSLAGGTPVSLALSSAAPLAHTWLVIGLDELSAPFKGGTLVPSVDQLLGPVLTDAAGTLVLQGTWPADIAADTAFWFQCWLADAAGPEGFAASHALKAVAP